MGIASSQACDSAYQNWKTLIKTKIAVTFLFVGIFFIKWKTVCSGGQMLLENALKMYIIDILIKIGKS